MDTEVNPPTDTPCLRVEDLVAAANTLLDETPTTVYWQMDDPEFVAFTFPDYDVAALYERPQWPRDPNLGHRSNYALLRHRTNPEGWLFIHGDHHRLLGPRGSTMGQFYRYRLPDYGRKTLTCGTMSEILAAHARSTHPEAWDDPLGWLLATFDSLLGRPCTQDELAVKKTITDQIDANRARRASYNTTA